MIKLSKHYTTMLKMGSNYNPYVEISEDKYNQLCERYGTYGISWYFTEFGSIKYFDGQWHYK